MTRKDVAPFLKNAGVPGEVVDYYERKFARNDNQPVDMEDFAGILRSLNSWQQQNFEPAVLHGFCNDY